MALKNVIEVGAAERALRSWWTAFAPEAQEVVVSDVTIPESSGMSSETILFRVDWSEDGTPREQEAVARIVPGDGQIFPSYDFEREARAMEAVRTTTAAPAPRVLTIEQDPEVLGAPFLLMDRHHGRVLADDPPFTVEGWLLDLSSDEQARLYDNGLIALAEMHKADIDQFSTDTLGHPSGGDPIEQQLVWWQGFYEWSAGGREHPTISAAFDWLRERVPAESRSGLSWGDARLGNLMFGDDLSVTGVLDWELVSLGPPELDLAWSMYINRVYTEGLGAPAPAGFPDRAATIARYEELVGHGVSDMDFHEVLAGTRMSIVILRIGTMMIEKQLLPEDAAMPFVNPAVQVLARTLDLEVPEADAATAWITGNR